MFVGVFSFFLLLLHLSVLCLFSLLHVKEHLTEPLRALPLSLVYLSTLWAGADRADVDNYKVFSQRANFGDVCLPRPLALSLSLCLSSRYPLLPLSCGSGPSQRTTTPQTLSTVFK